MEVELRILLKERQLCALACSNGHLATLKQPLDDAGERTLTVAEFCNDGNGLKTDEENAKTVHERIENEHFGSCLVLDRRKGLVFASLQDNKRVVIIPTAKTSKANRSLGLRANVADTGFQNPIFALVAVSGVSPNDTGDLVLAVSTTGELHLFCAIGVLNFLEVKSAKTLQLERVLAVSQFANDHVIVVGRKDSRIVACPLKLTSWESFASASVVQLPDIAFPDLPQSISPSLPNLEEGPILGFVLEASSCFVLYKGGLVHIITASNYTESVHGGSVNAWYGMSSSAYPSSAAEFPAPSHVFKLSLGSVRDNAALVSADGANGTEDVGDVLQLDGGYVAIGYGKYVSIWDGIYKVGHALIPLRGKAKMLRRGISPTKILVATESDVCEIRMGDSKSAAPLSLGLAIRRKGTCDAIIASIQQASEISPMRAQPVTVSAIKVAAESDGKTEFVFRGVVKSEDELEMKKVRILLSREASGSAESVALATKEFTTEYKKVRRGNHGNRSESGLSRLPSERLAAASVARCLYEIQFGHGKYVVPLIDMLGTGVVSNEAVLAVMGVSDSWEMGSDSEPLLLVSILDPLTKSSNFINAIEAIVGRVGDLPASDLVRVMQYAARMHDVNSVKVTAKEEDEKVSRDLEQDSMKRTRRAQARRLLLKCVTTGADKGRVISSLTRVPLADVITLLQQFRAILEDLSLCYSSLENSGVPAVPKNVSQGFFEKHHLDEEMTFLYRGVGNWLDKDIVAAREVLGEGSEVQGCIDWTCHLIDAHLTTLVLDGSGRDLVEELLGTVRQRRREAEALKGLHGLTSHIVGKRGLPENRDPLYSSSVREVAKHAALT